ncbi:MAG TPA: Rne/Rng family ribonuclease [Acidimicrobiales bacterium]|jgi:ribonuclease E
MSDPAEQPAPALPAPAPTTTAGGAEGAPDQAGAGPDGDGTPRKKRRRGKRGGRNRRRSGAPGAGVDTDVEADDTEDDDVDVEAADAPGAAVPPPPRPGDERLPDDLPDRHQEGRPRDPEAAERALVRRRPRIGDTLPPPPPAARPSSGNGDGNGNGAGGGRSAGRAEQAAPAASPGPADDGPSRRRRRRGGRGRGAGRTADEVAAAEEAEAAERVRARERKGKPVGRYLMCVHVRPDVTQIAVLEGRALIEHYVSRPADDAAQIHGNIYLGKVQNVLPGMEAAFVDIGTPKNAVLYRGDVHYDPEDVEEKGNAKIEHLLRPRQTILCQVTKNPIGSKGARLTQEVSLPGRFVVLIPGSSTYGISKRLPDDERKRLRAILDRVRPAGHGIIVRTAAEGVAADEIEGDVARLLAQWRDIEAKAKRSSAPSLLYREPDMAVRAIREEFNSEYRGVVIDDAGLHEAVRGYVAGISPALADRVQFYDPTVEPLPLFERFHVHEQLHKALDRKVWLPSGGSLIIEHTEALTVIDVNTGKNVGTSSLEETVYRNNLEAAVEIARQLRLRDIGGIIVIDFIDMEVRENREEVIRVFREALARDKTRTQVFDISELGLVEMTRKRIGEGLLESVSAVCPHCNGRGIVLDGDLLG